MSYRNLDPDRVVETVERLSRRITERFPDSGLSHVCQHLLTVARECKARAEWIARPVWSLRLATAALVLAVLAGMVAAFLAVLHVPLGQLELADLLQGTEAGVNELILLGAILFFLVSTERRIKRKRALKALHELRALAHIIDMHQLTKDPDRTQHQNRTTASSPRPTMDIFLLGRYLDYCTEMLSLVGKMAALLVQNFDDAVALAAASDLENLTTGLSRKIWQKIMLLHR